MVRMKLRKVDWMIIPRRPFPRGGAGIGACMMATIQALCRNRKRTRGTGGRVALVTGLCPCHILARVTRYKMS
jgi:hypothetical protein